MRNRSIDAARLSGVGTVARALAITKDGRASHVDLLKAAERLVAYGLLDEADAVLDRLRAEGRFGPEAARLAAAARQLRRSGVLQELQVLGETGDELVSGRHEALTAARAAGSKRLIIVFTGLAPRFWLSLMLLHAYLKRLDAHVIYLSDFRKLLFLDGVESIGKGYDVTVAALRRAADKLGVDHIHVMGNSAGGFGGLRYALDLGAESFIGMGMATDLSPDTGLPLAAYFRRPLLGETVPKMLIDLKPLILAAPNPGRITLFCGERNRTDRAHAEHIGDLPTVEVMMLPGYAAHDIVPGLLAAGSFEAVLRRFVYADAAAEVPS